MNENKQTNLWASERMQFLLEQAVKALANGGIPLSEWFLHEYNVTFDECVSLATLMSNILKGFLKTRKVVQDTIMITAIAEGTVNTENILDHLLLAELPQRIEDTMILQNPEQALSDKLTAKAKEYSSGTIEHIAYTFACQLACIHHEDATEVKAKLLEAAEDNEGSIRGRDRYLAQLYKEIAASL